MLSRPQYAFSAHAFSKAITRLRRRTLGMVLLPSRAEFIQKIVVVENYVRSGRNRLRCGVGA